MRVLARRIIVEAAVDAGLPEASVLDKAKVSDVLLPLPRLEVEYLPEGLARAGRRIAKLASGAIRSSLYGRRLDVRAEIAAGDEDWLEDFAVRFVVALPRKTGDDEGNLVVVTANKAERGGFAEAKLVEALKRRSIAIHITFSGMICRDESIPKIPSVTTTVTGFQEATYG